MTLCVLCTGLDVEARQRVQSAHQNPKEACCVMQQGAGSSREREREKAPPGPRSSSLGGAFPKAPCPPHPTPPTQPSPPTPRACHTRPLWPPTWTVGPWWSVPGEEDLALPPQGIITHAPTLMHSMPSWGFVLASPPPSPPSPSRPASTTVCLAHVVGCGWGGGWRRGCPSFALPRCPAHTLSLWGSCPHPNPPTHPPTPPTRPPWLLSP